MKSHKFIIACFFFVYTYGFFSIRVYCQSIENIGQQKPFVINGGVGLSYTATLTNDSNRVPMPAYWGTNINLNMKLFGIQIPLTAVYTNGKLTLTNSFNQFGISPSYKWITLHAGYRQFSFSPFTVSGQTIFGGGIELNPWKLRLGFFMGRLRRAVEVDSARMFEENIPGSYPLNITYENGKNYYSTQASYERRAWGAKVGFGDRNNFLDLIFFRGFDNSASITKKGNLNILPEENVVLGVNFFRKLQKHITLGVNAAASAYTYNTDIDPIATEIPFIDLINKIIVVRPTTQLQWAGEANLNISYTNFNILTSYKRAEPGFRSMGINSFMTDLNMLTIQPSWSLFKQKIRFNNVIQFQSDNLNGYKMLTTHRRLLNSAVSMNLSNNFGIDFNYNNNGISQIKTTAIIPDSVQASQNSQMFMVSPRLFFTTEKFSNVISLVTSFTDMQNRQVNGINNDVKNTYATLTNTFMLYTGGWSVNAGANYNSALTTLAELKSFGIIAGISKAMLNNALTLTSNSTFLFNQLNGAPNGTTVSIDFNAAFNFLKRNTLNVAYNFLYSPANGVYNFTDFNQSRFMVVYQYNF